MAEGVTNSVTKIILIVLSSLYIFVCGFGLFVLTIMLMIAPFTDHSKDVFTVFYVITFIVFLVGLVLSILALWGAIAENACLCYISLVWCILQAIGSVIQLFTCLSRDQDQRCSAEIYIYIFLVIILSIALAVCTFMFIRSIEQKTKPVVDAK